MPTLGKACAYPSCPEIIVQGKYCKKHNLYEKAVKPKYETRDSDYRSDPRYHTARWQRLRNRHLCKEPLCVECLKFDVTEAAETVDHIIEVKDGGDFWDENNLQSLCFSHHRVKTAKEKRKRNEK